MTILEFRLCEEIRRREDFGILLGSRGLTHKAVEIGTQRGTFARDFYSKWNGHKLYCVDPWHNPPGYAESGDPAASGDRQDDFRTARIRLRRFRRNVVFIPKVSVEAAEFFTHHEIDFAYIDADHRRESVLRDCRAWWPKVRHGGILAGHDLTGVWEPEVLPAVEQFAKEIAARTVWIVLGDAVDIYSPHGDAASWFIEKQGD